MKRAWGLFKGFWSFNTRAKISRRDFWITFVIVFIVYISFIVFGLYSLNFLDIFIETDQALIYVLFFFSFCFLYFWIRLIALIIGRLRDVGFSSQWYFLAIFAELTPFFIAYTKYPEIHGFDWLVYILMLYTLPVNYFQFLMLFPFLLCLLPSKTKDSPLP